MNGGPYDWGRDPDTRQDLLNPPWYNRDEDEEPLDADTQIDFWTVICCGFETADELRDFTARMDYIARSGG